MFTATPAKWYRENRRDWTESGGCCGPIWSYESLRRHVLAVRSENSSGPIPIFFFLLVCDMFILNVSKIEFTTGVGDEAWFLQRGNSPAFGQHRFRAHFAQHRAHYQHERRRLTAAARWRRLGRGIRNRHALSLLIIFITSPPK